jgi:hypothetical protein
LTPINGAPSHRRVDAADRSWAVSDSPARLNGDRPRGVVRQPQPADLGVEPAPEAQARRLVRSGLW